VSLAGEIDLDSVRPIAEWLSAAIANDDADIVVEMCDVTFIDSAGLCVLVRGAEFLERRGRHLTMRSPSSVVGRLLEICALSDMAEPATSDLSPAFAGQLGDLGA
jgi:anti-sigma B factor antagonist